MFLLFDCQSFFENFLNLKTQGDADKLLAAIAGRDPRQIRKYRKNDHIPSATLHKIHTSMDQKGLFYPESCFDEYMVNAHSWLACCKKAMEGREPGSDRVMLLLETLAHKDISFFESQRHIDQALQFENQKAYILDEVATFCQIDSDLIHSAAETKSQQEFKPYFKRIIYGCVLFLLSYAEADFAYDMFQKRDAVLSLFLPDHGNNKKINPVQKYFRHWMGLLSLDREGFVEVMLTHFGETGEADPDEEEDQPGNMTWDALEKQYSRYVVEGKIPSWGVFHKWVEGLFPYAIKKWDEEFNLEQYRRLHTHIFAGALILETLCEEGRKDFSEDGFFELISTYPSLYRTNFTNIKKEAGKKPAS